MRLIDADELWKHKFKSASERMDLNVAYMGGWNDAIDAIINNAPTVDPVKHGHWIRTPYTDYDDTYECSVCGDSWTFIEGTPKDNEAYYCPHCGAKMDEVKEWTGTKNV